MAKEKKKKKEQTSIRVSVETRDALTMFRIIDGCKSIGDYIDKLIENEVSKVNEDESKETVDTVAKVPKILLKRKYGRRSDE